jgi:hypothetical protein
MSMTQSNPQNMVFKDLFGRTCRLIVPVLRFDRLDLAKA